MARIKEANIQLGMSFETTMNGATTWLKPSIGFKLDLDEADSEPDNRRILMERLFEIAEEELSAELKRLLED